MLNYSQSKERMKSKVEYQLVKELVIELGLTLAISFLGALLIYIGSVY